MQRGKYVVPFSQLRMTDVESVGGKNASLGEMLSQLSGSGVRVPDGFATTAEAFREFLAASGLDRRIADRLASLDVDDVRALARSGEEIRGWLVDAPLPKQLEEEIRSSYQWLKGESSSEISVAVRSSATAEDLPDASFAGQQETFLNVVGVDAVIDRVKHVFASLYNDRRSPTGCTGLRPRRGCAVGRRATHGAQRPGRGGRDVHDGHRVGLPRRRVHHLVYGLGETVVQGAVNPDEFYVHKPMLAARGFPIIRRAIGSKLIKMEFEPAGSGAARCAPSTSRTPSAIASRSTTRTSSNSRATR